MTSRASSNQSTQRNLVIQSMCRFAIHGLFVSTLTLLLGCNSDAPSIEKKQSKKGMSSIDADSTDKSKVDEASRPSDERNAAKSRKKNTTNQPGRSDDTAMDKNTDNSSTDEASIAATKSNVTEKEKAAEESPPFKTYELLASMEVDYRVNALAFAPNGNTFVTCGDTPKIWEIGATEPLYIFEDIYPLTGTVVEPEAVTVSNDDKLLAFAGGDGIIYLFDYETREAKYEIQAHEAGVVSLSFSNDRKKLASSGHDGRAKIWNTETGEVIVTCDAQQDRRVRSAIAPDGSYLVTAGKEAEIWEASSGEKKAKLDIGEPRGMGVRSVDVSTDGKKIVTGDATKNFENAALVWSADSGKLDATLKHEYGVDLVAFSPDGQWLATGDMNGAARIWRLVDNQLVQTIRSEESFSIEAIQWTPDGKALAVSRDGTVRFWGLPGALNLVEGDQGNQPEDDAPNDSETTPNSDVENVEEKQPDSTQATVDAQTAPEEGHDWKNPAALSDAISAIDLREYPRLPDAQAEDFNVHITDLYYEALGELDDVFEFYQEKLAQDDWKPLPVDGRSNSGKQRVRAYTKNGFHLNVMASPASGKGRVTVNMTNFGNLDVSKLPRPADATTGYESGQFVHLRSEVSAIDAVNFIREKLIDAGYAEVRNFYDTEDSDKLRSQYDFIKNAICVTVYPAKTSKGCEITYGCRMLKFNAPISSDATNGVINDDKDFSVKYTASSSAKDVTEFYQSRAESFGWSFDKERSDIDDNGAQLHFDDAHTNQKIVVTILSNDEGKLNVAIQGEMAMKEKDTSKPSESVAAGDIKEPATQQDEAMKNLPSDARKALLDAQKQIVENLKKVDPERAKEIEAELQKMIDTANSTENQSNDNSDAGAQVALAASKFPVPEGAKDVTRDEKFGLIKYKADLKIETHAKFYRDFFLEKGWKETKSTMLDGYAQHTFEKDDFSIQISLIKDGNEGGMIATIKGDGLSWKSRLP